MLIFMPLRWDTGGALLNGGGAFFAAVLAGCGIWSRERQRAGNYLVDV
jgi:hypothetical protein